MRTLLLFSLVLLLNPGCDYIVDDCLFDDFGCALPGRWNLASVNGEPVSSGYFEIEEDYIPGDGYLDWPTGLAEPSNPESTDFSRIRGPFLGSYSGYALDEPRTFRFDLSLTGVACSIGNCIVNIYTRFEQMEDDRFILIITSVDDEIGDLDLGISEAPYLQAGRALEFRRSGRRR